MVSYTIDKTTILYVSK